jgi:hypothetical protein
MKLTQLPQVVRRCRRADRLRRSGPAGKSVVQAPAGCRCTVQGTDLARQLFGFRRYIMTTAAGQPARPAGRTRCMSAGPMWLCSCVPREVRRCDRRTCGQAGRGPGHRCSQPHSPGTLSLLSPSGYYFSSIYHFAMNTSNWIWKPRVRPRRVRMQPWLLRRRWIIMIGAAGTRD